MDRLQFIFSFIEKCGVFADVGCDHGKLCKLVLDNNLADKVYASDISAPSLKKAENLLTNYNNISFLLSDGFGSFPSLPDTAVISGMGGLQIINIIQKAAVKTLILQPQNQIPALRHYLNENSYNIIKDGLVKENGKFYTVLKAVLLSKGEKPALSKTQEEWGVFYKIKQPLLKEKLEQEKEKLTGYKKTAENLRKIGKINEVEQWQR